MSEERWRSPIENMAERLEDLAKYLDEVDLARSAMVWPDAYGSDVVRRAAHLLASQSEQQPGLVAGLRQHIKHMEAALEMAANVLTSSDTVTVAEERVVWDRYVDTMLARGQLTRDGALDEADRILAERRKRFPRRDGQ